jgi:hypothetical protein
LTAGAACREAGRVITVKPDRPYFEAWLRRTRRQFAVSGRLSQTAYLLAREHGESPDLWADRLRKLLDGNEPPSLELLTRIDALLSPRATGGTDESVQDTLFS